MTKKDDASGMRKGLTNYGDAGFSLFLRKAFIKGAGLTDHALDHPVIGIADTGSGYNPCHGNMPQLVEAVQRGIASGGLEAGTLLPESEQLIAWFQSLVVDALGADD